MKGTNKTTLSRFLWALVGLSQVAPPLTALRQQSLSEFSNDWQGRVGMEREGRGLGEMGGDWEGWAGTGRDGMTDERQMTVYLSVCHGKSNFCKEKTHLLVVFCVCVHSGRGSLNFEAGVFSAPADVSVRRSTIDTASHPLNGSFSPPLRSPLESPTEDLDPAAL